MTLMLRPGRMFDRDIKRQKPVEQRGSTVQRQMSGVGGKRRSDILARNGWFAPISDAQRR